MIEAVCQGKALIKIGMGFFVFCGDRVVKGEESLDDRYFARLPFFFFVVGIGTDSLLRHGPGS